MSKTSIALLIMFFLSMIALISFNTMYSSNPVLKSLPGIFPTQTVISENTLSIAPNPISALAGKPTAVEVTIDSKGAKPTLIQMELAYDPNSLTSVTLLPGNFYQNPEVLLNKVNGRNGRISYAIAPSKGQEDQTGPSVVATIQFTPRINSFKRETDLYFLPKTVVRTKDEPNTLKVAYGTKISIASSTTPFASPSAVLLNGNY